MLVFHRAQPEFETFFDRFYQLDLRTVWDLRFLQYLLYIIFLGLAISIFGMILARFRARRKNDLKKQMKILGCLYLALFFIYWLMIWGSRLSELWPI
jgi:H+/Cl- antiporter ClcA